METGSRKAECRPNFRTDRDNASEPRRTLRATRWRRSATVAVVLAAATTLGGCIYVNGVVRGVGDTFVSQSKRDAYHFQPDFTVADPQFRRSLDSVGDPMVAGNSVQLLENGERIFPAMTGDIHGAKVSVNLETFLFEDDAAGAQFADALIAASRRGVEVRLLVDEWGSNLGKLAKAMEDAGVKVAQYRPLHLYSLNRPGIRTHRKLMIVDGFVGYTGGLGIDKRWLGDARNGDEWRDTQVRVTGPVVAQLQAVFSENWTFTTGEILAGDRFYPALSPTGSMLAHAIKSSEGDASSLPKMMYFMAIQAADRFIHITNAYFIPDEQVRKALIGAVRRGVDVTVLVPGPGNDLPLLRQASNAHYGELLDGGVAIHEYRPTMMHSKTLVVDGLFSTIGSINFDARSMGINAEESLSVYDSDFADAMEQMFQRDLERSVRVTHEQWERRGFAKRSAELFSWILEPYL